MWMRKMSFNWAYLCNTPAFLDLLIRKMPRVRWAGLDKTLVVTDSKFISRQSDLQAIVKQYRHPNFANTIFVNGADAVPSDLHKSAYSYRLLQKLCLPALYLDEWLFYTDDDMLIMHDPSWLFDYEITASASHHDRLILSIRNTKMVEAIGSALQFDLTIDIYNSYLTSFGCLSIKARPQWIPLIRRFWENEYLQQLLLVNPDSDINRKFDQRFLTAYIAKLCKLPLLLGSAVHPYASWDMLNALKKKTQYPMLIHYACLDKLRAVSILDESIPNAK